MIEYICKYCEHPVLAGYRLMHAEWCPMRKGKP
jgi:hypothetical protein